MTLTDGQAWDGEPTTASLANGINVDWSGQNDFPIKKGFDNRRNLWKTCLDKCPLPVDTAGCVLYPQENILCRWPSVLGLHFS
jgi:hypothetical protein